MYKIVGGYGIWSCGALRLEKRTGRDYGEAQLVGQLVSGMGGDGFGHGVIFGALLLYSGMLVLSDLRQDVVLIATAWWPAR